MLPLMKPALISTSIFSFIWSWNDFLGPLLYLNTPEKYRCPWPCASSWTRPNPRTTVP